MPTPTSDERRWRHALERASFGVWDLDPRAELVHYSPPWKERLGFPAVDAPDSTSFWRSRVHPADLDAMLRALREHLDGYTASYEMRFRLNSGGAGYGPVLSRGRVVERDERGDALRMVGTMVEIDALAAPALPPAMVAERPSSLAPGLRTPLHVVLGVGALAAPPHPSAQRLLGLVDDLLDVALRESAGRGAGSRGFTR